jgi:hypothetical protein
MILRAFRGHAAPPDFLEKKTPDVLAHLQRTFSR